MDPIAQARIEAAVALRKALGLERLLDRLRMQPDTRVAKPSPRPDRAPERAQERAAPAA